MRYFLSKARQESVLVNDAAKKNVLGIFPFQKLVSNKFLFLNDTECS